MTVIYLVSIRAFSWCLRNLRRSNAAWSRCFSRAAFSAPEQLSPKQQFSYNQCDDFSFVFSGIWGFVFKKSWPHDFTFPRWWCHWRSMRVFLGFCKYIFCLVRRVWLAIVWCAHKLNLAKTFEVMTTYEFSFPRWWCTLGQYQYFCNFSKIQDLRMNA